MTAFPAQHYTRQLEPVSNPFPVYPVQSLGELSDIRAATVRTPEVTLVHEAVEAYVETFRTGSVSGQRHLVLAAKGDFGTGKTHLMLYARGVLEAKVAEIREEERKQRASEQKDDPTNSGEEEPRRRRRRSRTQQATGDDSGSLARIVMVSGSESPIEEWFTGVLGPALLALRPRELMRELMTEVACSVALENSSTAGLAREFRESPQALFRALREADEIDASEIERRFVNTLAELCPRTDAGFRRALAALRWGETASLAERWLAGETLDAAELERIGIQTPGDLSIRQSSAVCAIAAVCRSLGRPFGLLIDEFEHQARYDYRNESRRNITWVKRLVEALVRRDAMVFVCGHWEAWQQQGDFLDRFMGRPPIQLVRLSESDVIKIIQVRAPGWEKAFSPARAVRFWA